MFFKLHYFVYYIYCFNITRRHYVTGKEERRLFKLISKMLNRIIENLDN